MLTRSKRIQEDSEEKESSFPKAVDDVLNKKDQALMKVEVPTDGNRVLKKKMDENKRILTSPQVSLPFPHRVKNDQRVVQLRKFLQVMSKVHINLPFVKAISHMPSYAEHLKEILSNKGKLKILALWVSMRSVSL